MPGQEFMGNEGEQKVEAKRQTAPEQAFQYPMGMVAANCEYSENLR
jgi:hypothetical protein